MQMSVWMRVAAGCPFRRVITPFPSMTPRDTTVTYHLSQTPEDRERDRERQTFRENENGRRERKIKSDVHKQTCTQGYVCFSPSWCVFVLPLLLCAVRFIIYKCQGWKVISPSYQPAADYPMLQLETIIMFVYVLEREREKWWLTFCICSISSLTYTYTYFL